MRYLGLFVCLLLSVPLGMAEAVTFEFSGFIDTINDNTNNVLPGIYTGQAFEGRFSYSAVPDQRPTYPQYGSYHQTASISTSLGALDLDYIDSYIYIRTTNLDNCDSFSFLVDAINGDSTLAFTGYGIELIDFTGAVFNTDALPMSLDLAQFDSKRFLLRGYSFPDLDLFDVEGEITGLTLVPEPMSVLLLAFGCSLVKKRVVRASL